MRRLMFSLLLATQVGCLTPYSLYHPEPKQRELTSDWAHCSESGNANDTVSCMKQRGYKLITESEARAILGNAHFDREAMNLDGGIHMGLNGLKADTL